MVESGTRGPYRKGRERRQAILEAALTAYAMSSTAGPTLKAIAAEVGVTETAVLYYFSGRDELFTAVIEARDEAAIQVAGPEDTPSRYAGVIARNVKTPGLVRLYLEVAAAASSPDHPGHEYFPDRYRRLTGELAQSMAGLRPDLSAAEAAWVARMLVAAADGLQLQWLHDSSVDMAADLNRLVEWALRTPPA